MWTCYVLTNTRSGRAYCGMTNNLPRRVRQHNRELAGGARATAAGAGHWRVALAFCGFRTQREALQAEWRLKHPAGRRRRRRRGGGAAAVVRGVLGLLCTPGCRWTSRAPCAVADVPLLVCGDAGLVDALEDGVPVRLLRALRFRRGEAARLWCGEAARGDPADSGRAP